MLAASCCGPPSRAVPDRHGEQHSGGTQRPSRLADRAPAPASAAAAESSFRSIARRRRRSARRARPAPQAGHPAACCRSLDGRARRPRAGPRPGSPPWRPSSPPGTPGTATRPLVVAGCMDNAGALEGHPEFGRLGVESPQLGRRDGAVNGIPEELVAEVVVALVDVVERVQDRWRRPAPRCPARARRAGDRPSRPGRRG